MNAIFAPGSYVAKKYTILTAGSINGTFGSLTNTNLSSNFHTLAELRRHPRLSRTSILNFTTPPAGTINGNQHNVANALIHSFNTHRRHSPGVQRADCGRPVAGRRRDRDRIAATTFNAMTQFMGLMTDPFTAGRSDGAQCAVPMPARMRRERLRFVGQAALEERARGLCRALQQGAAGRDVRAALERVGRRFWRLADHRRQYRARIEHHHQPPVRHRGRRGLSSSRRNTVAGFALAGGGTSFSVNGFGSGRSDLFQAGAFIRHTAGAAYISGALAYGWQDVTTDRTVTIAGIDRLRAQFNANAFSGRAEGGYRFVAPWIGGIGITPYAAGQFTTFDLPAYAEQVVSGANTFALAYAAKSVTATRSELGLRADKSFAMQNAILTLRGRAAWAHDFNPDRAVGATFQTLPGASFVVNGARRPATPR